MKKFDIVKLIHLNDECLSKDLHLESRGLVLETNSKNSLILFFNDNRMGDYAQITIENSHLIKESQKIPEEFLKQLQDKNINKKSFFTSATIKEYDWVELTIEDEKYSKSGIHKGEKGCVAHSQIINNSVLVDFSGIDANGNYYGDCIPVNIKDLKLLK